MTITRRLLGAGALGLVARSAAGQQADGVLARIKRTGAMRFGAVPSQPPYCYKDLATGAWRGFLIDIAQDLAGELGVKATPVESTWGNAVLDLQSDKVDIFFGLAPTPQRRMAVDFTKPLYQNAFALVARKGFDPKTWAELNDPSVRIALETGTQYDQAIPELCPRATVTRLKTNNDAMLAVQTGRADCQIIVVIFALTNLTRNPALGHLVVPEPLFGATTNAIVAKEADPAFLTAVDAWIDRRRGAGELHRVLLANLEQVGVPAAKVPPQLLF